MRIMPVWTEEVAAVPVDISQSMLIGAPSKKVFTAQIGMSLTECKHQLEEPQELPVLLDQLPIEPTDLVVLTICIVIALLGASYFVSGQDHGNALREHENSEKILALALA